LTILRSAQDKFFDCRWQKDDFSTQFSAIGHETQKGGGSSAIRRRLTAEG